MRVRHPPGASRAQFPQAIERLLATPRMRARLPLRRDIVNRSGRMVEVRIVSPHGKPPRFGCNVHGGLTRRLGSAGRIGNSSVRLFEIEAWISDRTGPHRSPVDHGMEKHVAGVARPAGRAVRGSTRGGGADWNSDCGVRVSGAHRVPGPGISGLSARKPIPFAQACNGNSELPRNLPKRSHRA